MIKPKVILGYMLLIPLVLMCVGIVGFAIVKILLETVVGAALIASIFLFILGAGILNNEEKV